VLGLSYREVWTLDFEFVSESGDLPVPVCMVARELGSGRLIRLWQDELGAVPPFSTGDDVLFVAYFASAEIGCFLSLGWPVPTRILDLFTEFRNVTNGISLPGGRGLLGALTYHGISSITADQKHEERALVMGGGPWSPEEQIRILDYCQTDVNPMGALLERMLPGIVKHPNGFGQALLRGRYMAAVARMERTGVPIDIEMLDLLRSNWENIKLDLIEAIDKDYGVYEGTTFKAGLFACYLTDNGIDWPRTTTGRLQLDQDTFRDMAKRYPQLEPLKELRHALSELRLEKLAVGPDHRNRTLLSPFGASSGRNTPSNNKFIFGPSVWLRGLIKPPEGRALAYIDWKSQEVYIAAALSGDRALLDAVLSGDPYLAFAKMAGLVPPEATKQSHRAIRDMCKTCVLGTHYGMQAQSLAMRTGLSEIEAQDLLRRLAQTFPAFTAWAEHVVNVGELVGYLTTVFGWTLRAENTRRWTTLRNFPMQSNGAEMLRLACCLATERGVQVCAPVHDALLVEGDADTMEDTVAATRAAMAEASRVVLDGVEVDTDVEIIAWPGRYADDRGRVMWEHVAEILAGQTGRGGQEGREGQGDRGGQGGDISIPTPPPINPIRVVKWMSIVNP
jgi:DNA polymerase I